MPRSVTLQLGGWGNYPVHPASVFRPEKRRELGEILASGGVRDYISRGLGRSYGDAALNQGGGVILHERLNRFVAFDPSSGAVECEAGVAFADLLEVFVPRGFFPAVTPGTKYLTVGGAIAADVHGKNHHRDGSFASFVDEVRLLTAGGQVLTCSRTQHPEVFWATVGGMGLTGVIVSARLRLAPIETAYLRVDYRRARDLDEALDAFLSSDAGYRYSVAWIDCLASGKSLGRSVLIRGNPAGRAELPEKLRRDPLVVHRPPRKRVPLALPSWVLRPASVRVFNNVYYRRHPTREGAIVHYDPFFYPLDSILHWNRIYGKRGFVQYQAVFPPKSSRAGLIRLLERFAATGRASFLAVLKSFGLGNEGLLSFPFPGHTLALDISYTGADLLRFTDELDRIVLEHGGRVYLAKDACLNAEKCAAMYPNVPRFREIKRQLDPQQRIASSLGRRVGLVERT